MNEEQIRKIIRETIFEIAHKPVVCEISLTRSIVRKELGHC